MVGEPFGSAMSEKSSSVESRAGAHPGQRVLRLTGRVDLETVPRFLQAVLELTRVHKLFAVFPTVAEAEQLLG